VKKIAQIVAQTVFWTNLVTKFFSGRKLANNLGSLCKLNEIAISIGENSPNLVSLLSILQL
jgi:hypothetical protein